MTIRSPRLSEAEARPRAIFVNQLAILRDSHIAPDSDPGKWRLTPSTLEAVRLLGIDDRLVIVVEPPTAPGQTAAPGTAHEASAAQNVEGRAQRSRTLASLVALGGGRLDAVLACPHSVPCTCWGDAPGLLWLAAAEFGLELGACYLLADTAEDVRAAVAAGLRPVLVLGDRRIGALFGDSPPRKDYPCAEDLSAAVGYITVEDEINSQLGQPRESRVPAAPPDALAGLQPAAAALTPLSRLAQSMQAQVSRRRTQLQDVFRWLSFLVIGAIGLGLGVAYLLTHLYRRQAFPAFAYYLTLQFIPRPLRGALFILIGVAIIAPALRAWLRAVRART